MSEFLRYLLDKRAEKKAVIEDRKQRDIDENAREAAEMLRRDREAMSSRVKQMRDNHSGKSSSIQRAPMAGGTSKGQKSTPERLARIIVFALGDKIEREVRQAVSTEISNPQNYTNRAIAVVDDKLDSANKSLNKLLDYSITTHKMLEKLSKNISRGSGTSFFPDLDIPGNKKGKGFKMPTGAELGLMARAFTWMASFGLGVQSLGDTPGDTFEEQVANQKKYREGLEKLFGIKKTPSHSQERERDTSLDRIIRQREFNGTNLSPLMTPPNLATSDEVGPKPRRMLKPDNAIKEQKILELKQKISVLREGISYHLSQSPEWQKRYHNRYTKALQDLERYQRELAALEGLTPGPKPRRLLKPNKAVSKPSTIQNMLNGMNRFAPKNPSVSNQNASDDSAFYFMPQKRQSNNIEYRFGDNNINPTNSIRYKRLFGGFDTGMGTYLAPQMSGQYSGNGFSPRTTYDGSYNGYSTSDPRQENDGRNGPSSTIARQYEQRKRTEARLFSNTPMMPGKDVKSTITNVKSRNAGISQGAGSMLTDAKGRVISTADTNLPVHQRAFLDTLAMGNATSGGNYWESPDYNTIVGGKKFTDMSKHPEIFGTPDSTAAGRYQFTKTTWKDVVRRYNRENPDNPITDFSAKNQDSAAYFLAQKDYARRTGGRNLDEDLKAGNTEHIRSGLGGMGMDTTWQILQKKSVSDIDSAYRANLARNQEYATQPGQLSDKSKSTFDTLLNPDARISTNKKFDPVNPSKPMTNSFVQMSNQGKIRDKPISDNLSDVLNYAGSQSGIDKVEVTSGGQDAIGTRGKRTGSTRHDNGNAADLVLWRGGKKLDFNNPDDRAVMQAFVRNASKAGATGIGAGNEYMGGNTLHVGFGKEATWGSAGKGDGWVAQAAAEGRKERSGFNLSTWKKETEAKKSTPDVVKMKPSAMKFRLDKNGKLVPDFELVAGQTGLEKHPLFRKMKKATEAESLVPPRQEDIERRARETEENAKKQREKEREMSVARARAAMPKPDEKVGTVQGNTHKRMSGSLAAVNRQSKGQNPANARDSHVSGVVNMPTYWSKIDEV